MSDPSTEPLVSARVFTAWCPACGHGPGQKCQPTTADHPTTLARWTDGGMIAVHVSRTAGPLAVPCHVCPARVGEPCTRELDGVTGSHSSRGEISRSTFAARGGTYASETTAIDYGSADWEWRARFAARGGDGG